ncbi:hypothetical protein U1Q18_003267, partial [Sarracenia purpurea var. burkii]
IGSFSSIRDRTRRFEIVLQKISHGGNHGGLTGSRRTVKEITALPCLSDLCVVVFSFGESDEIGFKHRMVLEHDVTPHCSLGANPFLGLIVGEELSLSSLIVSLGD